MIIILSLIESILEVKKFKQLLLLCCWGMSVPVDALFFLTVI